MNNYGTMNRSTTNKNIVLSKTVNSYEGSKYLPFVNTYNKILSMNKNEAKRFFRMAVPIGLLIISLLTACGAQGATITTAQGKTNVPFGQSYGLILGPNSSFSLPQTGKDLAEFSVGQNDEIGISGSVMVSPDGTFRITDENQECDLSISPRDGDSSTPVQFTIECGAPASTEEVSPSPSPSPEVAP